jgi:hypothetical protein
MCDTKFMPSAKLPTAVNALRRSRLADRIPVASNPSRIRGSGAGANDLGGIVGGRVVQHQQFEVGEVLREDAT